MKSPWAAIGGLLAILPTLIKGKKYVLWYRQLDTKWVKKSNPMSHRQCRKTRNVLVAIGPYLADRFAILRDGVTP